MALTQLCQLLLPSGVNVCLEHSGLFLWWTLPTLVREQNYTIWGAHPPTGDAAEAPSHAHGLCAYQVLYLCVCRAILELPVDKTTLGLPVY